MTTKNDLQTNAVTDQAPTSEDRKWYVLYTRSRHEKFVETHLLRKGLDAFTPKVTLRKRWSDRTKIVEEPVFKSYCFARFSMSERLKIITQKGVVSIVNINGQYVPVEDSVIDSLRILVDNGLRIDPCPYLKKGDRIVISKGPLKGLEGYILEKRDRNSVLVVSVDAIASSVRCFVDADCVEHA